MYPFSPSVTPAVRSHLDAQVSFFNDMSRSLSRSFQHMCELNMQLGQTLLEESNIAGQQMLTVDSPTEALSAAASRAQPATEKLRAYQQHVSRAVADSQVDLARVTEQHVQETSRTARDLADHVAKAAADEQEKSLRSQEQVLKNFRDPFGHQGSRSMQHAEGGAGAHMEVQVDGHQAGFQGNMQGSTAQSGAKQNKPHAA